MSEAKVVRRLRIHGLVQGVWFRGWAVEQAQALGLDGWVRNRHDGTVEMVIAGPSAAADEMQRRCQAGPPAAAVSLVEPCPEPSSPPPGFRQRPTA